MFVKISKPPIGDNKASCQKLANYLSKEVGTFFDRHNMDVSYDQLITAIDTNTSRLGIKDDKFYMLSINPSQDELEHLLGKSIPDAHLLSPSDRKMIEEKLKHYTHTVMDAYAKNFHRESVKDGDNLLYFSRIETQRTYTFYDAAVKTGLRKEGEAKEGLHYHVHVIVSRKSKDGKCKLSPNAKSRGNAWQLNGKETIRGFNHVQFKVDCINQFNTHFNCKSDYDTHYRLCQKAKHSPVFFTSKIPSTAVKTLSSGIAKINRLTGVHTSQHFSTELKMIRTGSRVAKILVNPKAAFVQETVAAFKKLVTGILEKGASRGL